MSVPIDFNLLRMEESTENDNHLRKHFKTLVLALRSDSNNVIYKALCQLRADTEKHKFANKYLCEIDAFNILVKFLNLPNHKILNAVLNLLANGALHENSRQQVC